METQLFSAKGKEIGMVQLPDGIFGRKPSPQFLHELVTAYRANQRSGSAHTKTRGEVSGGGRKPWKQKGTGRARSGSIRSPLWRKGGVTFGPKHRSYRQDFSQRKQRLALCHALSARNLQGDVVVIESLSLEAAKCGEMAKALEQLRVPFRSLLVMDEIEPRLVTASKNIPGLRLARAADLNAYQALNGAKVVFTQSGLKALENRVGGAPA
ncbi:MAG: 50S ribosomal protein L4 [Elusimicrobia bacterium]|nr:50S ribosomal protein L4 [Elusimicrobiota bacterium]